MEYEALAFCFRFLCLRLRCRFVSPHNVCVIISPSLEYPAGNIFAGFKLCHQPVMYPLLHALSCLLIRVAWTFRVITEGLI